MTAVVGWRPLGATDPRTLSPVRNELHRAAVAIEQVGKTLVEPEDDYGHIALRYDAVRGGLVTAAVAGGVRALLRPGAAELAVVRVGEAEPLATLPLAGRTLGEAAAWVRSEIGWRAGYEGVWAPMRTEGLPDTPVAEGRPFTPPDARHEELDRAFADAAGLLEEGARERPGASPVRCWPHHFDLATSFRFDAGTDPEAARSVTLGFSPGDVGIPEPYFYLLPWPPPDPTSLPPLAAPGAWVTEGWVGAALTLSELVAEGPEQAAAAARFLDEARAGAERALGVAP